MQVLPLILFALRRAPARQERAFRLMLTAAASYAVLFAIAALAGASRQSIVDPDATTLTAILRRGRALTARRRGSLRRAACRSPLDAL